MAGLSACQGWMEKSHSVLTKCRDIQTSFVSFESAILQRYPKKNAKRQQLVSALVKSHCAHYLLIIFVYLLLPKLWVSNIGLFKSSLTFNLESIRPFCLSYGTIRPHPATTALLKPWSLNSNPYQTPPPHPPSSPWWWNAGVIAPFVFLTDLYIHATLFIGILLPSGCCTLGLGRGRVGSGCNHGLNSELQHSVKHGGITPWSFQPPLLNPVLNTMFTKVQL